jgi:hypothetical protein
MDNGSPPPCRQHGGFGDGDAKQHSLEQPGPKKYVPMCGISHIFADQNVPSAARVAAGAFGFLILIAK